MTKKDFEAVAAVIKDRRIFFQLIAAPSPAENIDPTGFDLGLALAIDHVAFELAKAFEQNNPHFDRARFLAACGIE